MRTARHRSPHARLLLGVCVATFAAGCARTGTNPAATTSPETSVPAGSADDTPAHTSHGWPKVPGTGGARGPELPDDLSATAAAAHIDLLAESDDHDLATITVTVNGAPITIPSELGIGKQVAPIHSYRAESHNSESHNSESRNSESHNVALHREHTPTLAQFFRLWGIEPRADTLCDAFVGAQARCQVTVSVTNDAGAAAGEPVNTSLDTVVVDGDRIRVDISATGDQG